ncbi:phage virion morphogenesis protein [Rhodobacter capsulatus]|uniref:phage virion morphogenesis protein n=1 Tax=Rhodobacter capsulatus TaxID=1061 RepID=UPI0040266188
MITIEFRDGEILAGIDRLQDQLGDMTSFMDDLGELLVASTKARFPAGTAPDGIAWVPNSPATLARKSDSRPLFGTSGSLNSQIFATTGPDFVRVGSNRVQAAMMQFGGSKSVYAHLWGDIPARPYLGLSDEDKENILAETNDWLSGAFSGD